MSQLCHAATQQICFWKLGQSCSKHAGKHMQCSIILVKLHDKFTWITLHALVQSTVPSHNHLVRKLQTGVSMGFQVHHPKICRNCIHVKFSHQGTGGKLESTQCDNFLYISHELHRNQSSRIYQVSCQWFFVMFSVVRFVIAK